MEKSHWLFLKGTSEILPSSSAYTNTLSPLFHQPNTMTAISKHCFFAQIYISFLHIAPILTFSFLSDPVNPNTLHLQYIHLIPLCCPPPDTLPSDPLQSQYDSWLSLVDHLNIKSFVNLTLADSVRHGVQHLLFISGLGQCLHHQKHTQLKILISSDIIIKATAVWEVLYVIIAYF